MRFPVFSFSVFVFLAVLLAFADVLAQDPEEGKKGREEAEGTSEEDETRPSGLTESEEEAILRRFHATEESFTDKGRLRLVYDFQKQQGIVLKDWSPEIEKTDRRIRWSHRHRHTFRSALMVADHGIWIHRALWKSEVQIDMQGICYGQIKGPQYFSVGIVDPNGKKGIASNLGRQVLQLRGLKIGGARPRSFPETSVEQPLNFGAGIDYEVFSTRQAEENTDHTKELRRFDRFRAAIFWNGDRVQVGIHKLIIEGRIDEDWLKKNP